MFVHMLRESLFGGKSLLALSTFMCSALSMDYSHMGNQRECRQSFIAKGAIDLSWHLLWQFFSEWLGSGRGHGGRVFCAVCSTSLHFELSPKWFGHSICHPVTWIQRKSHRFGQGAHVDWGKIGQDPAGLVLTLKTWALYSVRCPGRRPSILMSHSHRHRNKKEGGWIYILSRSIKQWIVNNLFHAIKIKIACCLVSWVILCDNERYVMCSN